MPAHPTIRDVAARAGVSRQTVSRVINQDPRVAEATRAQVERAVSDLGYQPNVIARAMSRGRAHTLACLSPNLTDYTFASIIEGAEAEARKLGYFLLSSSAPEVGAFTALANELVSGRRVDGMLVITPYIDGRDKHLPECPAVLIGATSRRRGVGSLTLDEGCAGQLAIDHLLGLGHRRIGMIHGPTIEDCVRDRSAGARAALKRAGLSLPAERVAGGDWSPTSGYRAMHRLLERAPDLTGVFVQNDQMAVGAIRAAREAGRRVPDDLSIVGFDDIPAASYIDPPLTTIRQDFAAMGRAAVHELISLIEAPIDRPIHKLMAPELLTRQSTSRRVD
jgi:DNA-binding LacI/PurR family transcriptional regulator